MYVTSQKMLQSARMGGYAVGAFNVENLEMAQGVIAAASALHLKYMDLFNKLFIEVNPQPVKTALNLMGFDVGGFRLPLCEMAPANVEKLRQAMVAVGLTVQ